MKQESEKVKKVPSPNLGGARPGAGRKAGGLNQKTLETREALNHFRERVRSQVDVLLNSQLLIARGEQFLFRIDEHEDDKGKKRKEHVLVTDPEEMKQALDDDLVDGENYYYISSHSPDNKALDSLLDRTFGRATQSVEVSGKDGDPIKTENTLSPDQEKAISLAIAKAFEENTL